MKCSAKLFDLMTKRFEKTNKCLQELSDSDNSCKDVGLITNVNEVFIFPNEFKAEMGENVLQDAEFFDCFNSGDQNTVFSKLNKNLSTYGGGSLMKHVLSNPSNDIDIIKDRINLVTQFESKPLLYEEFKTLSDTENDVGWFFKKHEKHVEDLLNSAFFNVLFMRPFNKSSKLLTFYTIYKIFLNPLIGLLSPIITFIVPFLIFTIKLRIPISLSQYCSMFSASTSILYNQDIRLRFAIFLSYGFSCFVYIQGIFNNYFIAKTCWQITSYIETKVDSLIAFMNAANKLIEYYIPEGSQSLLEKAFGYRNTMTGSKLGIDLGKTRSIGSKLNCYKFVSRETIRALCEKVFMLDALKAIAMFKKENMFCHPVFVDSKDKGVVMKLKSVCHPCIDIKKVITNDFEYDSRNIIITGPNAGGKSTFMKSLLVNVLLSQSIGVSNASYCEMTIFEKIVSQINIPDCKGKESLFEAEMNRSKKTIDSVSTGARTFIVMDELFNSTNPVEGISGGYSVCKKITNCKNALLILSTHYEYLTRLEVETNAFRNLKMNVNIQDDGSIKFPYKIVKGISSQYIALELLRLNGFDKEIIEEALSLKSKILSVVPCK